MEKLQAALEKARSKRNDGPPAQTTAARPRTPQASAGQGTHEDRLWNDLPMIPLSARTLEEHRIVTREASLQATPFDVMRTKILLQMQQNNWKRLAITSPMPKSGKTTMACNLALGLGRQHKLRSMLFDLDLNDPSVGTFFDHQVDNPISEVLTGRVAFADQAVRIGDNSAVSMSSHIQDDPTRILLSETTEAVLDQIQDDYKPDIMIFDLPSMLVGDNTQAFLKNVDCALIVARANSTRFGQFDTCEREISENTNVLGVVLNAFRHGAAPNDFD